MKFQHVEKSIAPSINNEALYYLNKMSYQLNQIILIHGESLMWQCMIFIQRVIWVFVLSPDQFLRVKKKVDHLKLGMPEGNMYCLYIQYSQKASNNLVLIKLYLIKIGIFMIT